MPSCISSTDERAQSPLLVVTVSDQQMRLAKFILSDLENILSDWDEFARTRGAEGLGMTELALRIDAEALLHQIATDMGTPQTLDEQHVKSRGEVGDARFDATRPAHAHAVQRAERIRSQPDGLRVSRASRDSFEALTSDETAGTVFAVRLPRIPLTPA